MCGPFAVETAPTGAGCFSAVHHRQIRVEFSVGSTRKLLGLGFSSSQCAAAGLGFSLSQCAAAGLGFSLSQCAAAGLGFSWERPWLRSCVRPIRGRDRSHGDGVGSQVGVSSSDPRGIFRWVDPQAAGVGLFVGSVCCCRSGPEARGRANHRPLSARGCSRYGRIHPVRPAAYRAQGWQCRLPPGQRARALHAA